MIPKSYLVRVLKSGSNVKLVPTTRSLLARYVANVSAWSVLRFMSVFDLNDKFRYSSPRLKSGSLFEGALCA